MCVAQDAHEWAPTNAGHVVRSIQSLTILVYFAATIDGSIAERESVGKIYYEKYSSSLFSFYHLPHVIIRTPAHVTHQTS